VCWQRGPPLAPCASALRPDRARPPPAPAPPRQIGGARAREMRLMIWNAAIKCINVRAGAALWGAAAARGRGHGGAGR
jgi:hypothetical protein